MKNSELVLRLIESDIVHSKLINTLNDIGIDSNHYLTDVSEVVFELVGVNIKFRTDRLYKKYFYMIDRGRKIDIVNGKEDLKMYSKEIFDYLLNFKVN